MKLEKSVKIRKIIKIRIFRKLVWNEIRKIHENPENLQNPYISQIRMKLEKSVKIQKIIKIRIFRFVWNEIRKILENPEN